MKLLFNHLDKINMVAVNRYGKRSRVMAKLEYLLFWNFCSLV